MRYSCFQDGEGLYDIYDDGAGTPINTDMGIPTLGTDASDLGVPATESGMTIPSGAKKVGQSWRAQGILARCPSKTAFGAFGDDGSVVPLVALAIGIATALFLLTME